MSSILKGIAASNGIAIAKAYRLVEPDLSFDKKSVENADEEVARFQKAISTSKSELEAIRDKAREDLGGRQGPDL